MTLTVLDRILLLNLLPAEGDITAVRIARKLREDLSFSEQEHTDLQLKQVDSQVTWDTDAAARADKDIAIGPKALTLITDALTQLSERKKLTAQHLSLYDKFFPAE